VCVWWWWGVCECAPPQQHVLPYYIHRNTNL